MTNSLECSGQATRKVAFRWWLAAVFLAMAAVPGSTNEDVIFKDGFENRAPVIESTPVTSGKVNVPYSYDVDATDIDGDLLMYALLQSPGGMVIDEFSGVINWTPTETGNVPVEVIVTDGNLGSAQQAWQIEITEITVSCTLDLIILFRISH